MRSPSAGYAVASFQYVHIPVPFSLQIASCWSERAWSNLSAAQVLVSVAFRNSEAETTKDCYSEMSGREARRTVVLQIGANARQVDDTVDVEAGDKGLGTHTRKLEDLRRSDRPAATRR
jgi:hypothetical protein